MTEPVDFPRVKYLTFLPTLDANQALASPKPYLASTLPGTESIFRSPQKSLTLPHIPTTTKSPRFTTFQKDSWQLIDASITLPPLHLPVQAKRQRVFLNPWEALR
jgi:hypothetical protein